MAETNIDDLLSILELSETILNYNSEIKSEINSNGGSIIYSYNNIILATEISDELYAELKKSSYIDYIVFLINYLKFASNSLISSGIDFNKSDRGSHVKSFRSLNPLHSIKYSVCLLWWRFSCIFLIIYLLEYVA
jgi:hypothetical protein